MVAVDLPVLPPVKPMLSKAAPIDRALDLLREGRAHVEPKWDGFRSC